MRIKTWDHPLRRCFPLHFKCVYVWTSSRRPALSILLSSQLSALRAQSSLLRMTTGWSSIHWPLCATPPCDQVYLPRPCFMSSAHAPSYIVFLSAATHLPCLPSRRLCVSGSHSDLKRAAANSKLTHAFCSARSRHRTRRHCWRPRASRARASGSPSTRQRSERRRPRCTCRSHGICLPPTLHRRPRRR